MGRPQAADTEKQLADRSAMQHDAWLQYDWGGTTAKGGVPPCEQARPFALCAQLSEKDTKLPQELGKLQPFMLHCHRKAWPSLHLLGQPNTLLPRPGGRNSPVGASRSAIGLGRLVALHDRPSALHQIR